jgi:hypothetical protein
MVASRLSARASWRLSNSPPYSFKVVVIER